MENQSTRKTQRADRFDEPSAEMQHIGSVPPLMVAAVCFQRLDRFLHWLNLFKVHHGNCRLP
ncbi:hypothetical protein Bca4012_037532 [Brassica carinata]